MTLQKSRGDIVTQDTQRDENISLRKPIHELLNEISLTYQADNRPWIIGFSGGKDSTAVLSLVYSALQRLPKEKRHKHVYVVSSDTLVETPVVVNLITTVLTTINTQAKQDGIPMTAHPVFPKMDQTFWVNLLGRGYPAPQQSFRWCTERMKINPVSDFIKEKVTKHGEVIIALGSRRQESSSRAQVIAKHRITNSVLGRHSSLPNAYTYMPIEHWSADEVWEYLLEEPCPWGGDNWKLFELYKGSNQGECPLVIDTNTPSCGNSRFGCWTCTVVTEDKALHGLIQSGEQWMQPLLDFRNALHVSTKPENKTQYRNYKRRTGKVSYARGAINDDTQKELQHVPGPYWLKQRQQWLRDLLRIEKSLHDTGHSITLIQEEELHAIRKEWQQDPNEPDWMDTLPKIYAEIYPERYINWLEQDTGTFTEKDTELLYRLANEYKTPAELLMKLIETEISVMGLGNRRGILTKLETILNQDWGSLEDIKADHEASLYNSWQDKLDDLNKKYNEVSRYDY